MKAINLRRGLLRLWIVLAVVWLIAAGAFAHSVDAFKDLSNLWVFDIPDGGECAGVNLASIRSDLTLFDAEGVAVDDGGSTVLLSEELVPEAPPGFTYLRRNVRAMSYGVLLEKSLKIRLGRGRAAHEGQVPVEARQHQIEVFCHNRAVLTNEAARQVNAKLATIAGAGVGPPLVLFLIGAVLLWIIRGFGPR